MKFSASTSLFLAVCLFYVHASQPETKTFDGNRPTSYLPRPHHPKPHHPLSHKPLPYHPKPFHPKPYEPKPYDPKPHHPKPYSPLIHHPKPQRPKPHRPLTHRPKPHRPLTHRPKPHHPLTHRPKPQQPSRPWTMKPQSANNNININRNKNSNEDIILAQIFSQLFASKEDPCLFGMGCFDRKPKTKDVVIEDAAEKTQEQDAVLASDAEANLDQTTEADEEDAVIMESRQDGLAEEDDGFAMF